MGIKTSIVIVSIAVAIAVSVVAISTDFGDSSPDDEGSLNKKAWNDIWSERYKDGSEQYPARLLVLGNADMNDVIDENDIVTIESLIANGYDYVEDFMADANYDGLIDSADIERTRELIDYNGYKGMAYYFNCGFEIAGYDMSRPVHTSNILTQTLEMLCILAPESIVAVDDRCSNSDVKGANPQGTYWKEYASVIDYSKMGSVGSHKSPNVERYLQVATEYGDGYLTAVMNAKDAQNTGYMEKILKGQSRVQIVRVPSWERGGIANGMLTLGFLIHKFDRATEWVEWHDGYYNDIMQKVSELTDDQRKKVAIAVLGDTDISTLNEFQMNYTTSGEWQGLKRMGVIDVGGDYITKHSPGGVAYGAWEVALSKESFIAMCKEAGGLDYLIGSIPGPYNVSPINPSKLPAQDYMNKVQDFLNKSCGGATLQIIGWEYATGPNDLMYYAMLANVLYGWGYDIEKIVNESLQWMGVYGDGEYQWTFEKIKESSLLPYDI